MKTVACYSNKGGVGKTAAAVNLAYALSVAGVRTLLCDLDPQGASSYYFRVKPSKKLQDRQFFTEETRFARAIRGSDYDNLDILPANSSFRDFDVILSDMRKSRTRLRDTLDAVGQDYDVVILDCPPTFSTLAENVIRASDVILIPVIPSTLSQRTFEQLVAFFDEKGFPIEKIHAFFSMVQRVKRMHGMIISDMRKTYPGHFMSAQVPFASEVERMGEGRAPVMATARDSRASLAYLGLCEETVRLLFHAEAKPA